MATLLRTSERTTFMKCRQRWWWSYVEGWQPKTSAPALRFGTLVHKALEARYPPGRKRGPEPARTFEALYEEELQEQEKFGFRDEDGTWHDAGVMGVSILEEFVDEYGDDDEWEVISSEQTFRVRISRGLTYVGTFDGVWKNRRSKVIVLKEWKTAATVWDDFLHLDEQAGSYWAFAPGWLRRKGILQPDQDMKGILYTFLRKAKPDDRPRNELGQYLNKDGTVSKRQPAPLFHRQLVYRDRMDRQMIRGRVKAQAAEMEMVRDGRLMAYKAPNMMTCRGCPFMGVCELHETGADYRPLLQGAFEKYNPYSDHEIQEEGK